MFRFLRRVVCAVVGCRWRETPVPEKLRAAVRAAAPDAVVVGHRTCARCGWAAVRIEVPDPPEGGSCEG